VEQSKRRRMQRERELALWERELRRVLSEVRASLSCAANDVLADDILVGEVLRLADPYAYAGLDAVIPAPRVDLVRVWFRARLTGAADTDAQRAALARRIAPAPDDDPAGPFAWGVDRASVERAVIYDRRRRERGD
jgi:hypothetical protein